MLEGFPLDFPSSLNQNESNMMICESFECEPVVTAIFVRSELEELENANMVKKPKIDFGITPLAERTEIIFKDRQQDTCGCRHVKFSGDPPKEYLTFPDSEYDRSPLNKPNKYKRYLIYDNWKI